MLNKTIISVLIPYYNNAKEIKRSLSSVFRQTFQDFEVLLINDASPDWEDALPILNSFNDKRLKLISHKTNQNGAVARNTGIKAAQGEFIAFLDADDEWYSSHLEEGIGFMKNNCCELVSSMVKLINSNGIFYSPQEQKEDEESVATYLFTKGMSMYTPSIICKTSLARDVLFDETLKRHQDFDFLIQAEIKKYKLCTSPHLGGIVHWEKNNTIIKGETWQFSNEWLTKRKDLFTKKEADNFWIQFVGFKILRINKKLFMLEFLKNRINIFYLNRSRIRLMVTELFK